MDSFFEPLLSFASTITIESLATSTEAAVNSLRSKANTPLDALNPDPAIAVTKSAMDSFFEPLLSFTSIKPIKSFATSITAALKEFKSVDPPPEDAIVIVSLVALVVIVTFDPAAKVSVSVELSATTLLWPETAIVLKVFPPPPAFAAHDNTPAVVDERTFPFASG